jgi:hypothetical protein
MPIIQHKHLAPLIEPNEIQCQWSGCDLLFSTPIQLTEVQKTIKMTFLYIFSRSIFDLFISIELILVHGFVNGNHVHVIEFHLNLSIPYFFIYEHIHKIVRINVDISIAQKHLPELNIYDYMNVHIQVKNLINVNIPIVQKHLVIHRIELNMLNEHI